MLEIFLEIWIPLPPCTSTTYFPVREKLGYAKLADPAKFAEEYDKINEEMKAQIAEVLEGGSDND